MKLQLGGGNPGELVVLGNPGKLGEPRKSGLMKETLLHIENICQSACH